MKMVGAIRARIKPVNDLTRKDRTESPRHREELRCRVTIQFEEGETKDKKSVSPAICPILVESHFCIRP